MVEVDVEVDVEVGVGVDVVVVVVVEVEVEVEVEVVVGVDVVVVVVVEVEVEVDVEVDVEVEVEVVVDLVYFSKTGRVNNGSVVLTESESGGETMSDELRAAAERILNPPVFWLGHPSGHGTVDIRIDDATAVAKAYLAEHPADDDSAITREFLDRCLNFYQDEESEDRYWWINPIKRVRFDVQVREPVDGVRWQCVLANEGGHLEMPDLLTRGDVLRLLAALGIEVRK